MSLVTADQLVAHAVGDYVAQSDWMAQGKVERAAPAAAHAVTYALCFLPLTRNPLRLAAIGGTHYLIDRYRLAKYVAFAKNRIAPRAEHLPWDDHTRTTGYHDDMAIPVAPWTITQTHCTDAKQPWMSVWLMIALDNTMHVILNAVALRRSAP